MEFEEPGFTDDDLGIEDPETGRIADTDIEIPNDFLTLVNQAKQTGMENLPVQVVELDSL